MRFRKLRIAWSIGCGITCALLIVLCVRSYWRADSVMLHYRNVTPLGHYFLIASNQGRCACLHVTSGVFPWWINGTASPLPKEDVELFPFNVTDTRSWIGFGAYWLSSTDYGVLVPHWFLLVLAGTFAALPWLRWRFTLRTLLIATTLVAVVLGLAVWFRR